MATISAQSPSFFDRFRFAIEVDGVQRAAFTTCSELAMEVETITHFEGGVTRGHKTPGRLTVDAVTLERGVVQGDSDLYTWFLEIVNAAVDSPIGAGIGTGTGTRDSNFKRTLDVLALDRDGTERQRFRLHAAWPKRIVLGAFDNNADEKVMESVVLELDYVELVPRQA